MEQQRKLITEKNMREGKLGGTSSMTVHRLHKNPAAGFPRPVYINGRKFYYEDEIDAWIASRPRDSSGTRPGSATGRAA